MFVHPPVLAGDAVDGAALHSPLGIDYCYCYGDFLVDWQQRQLLPISDCPDLVCLGTFGVTVAGNFVAGAVAEVELGAGAEIVWGVVLCSGSRDIAVLSDLQKNR